MNHPDSEQEQALRCDILRIERYLAGAAAHEDCAYDKVRIRAYQELLDQYHTRLKALAGACT